MHIDTQNWNLLTIDLAKQIKTCWYGVHFSGSVEVFLPAQTITWNLDKEYHLQSSGRIERNKQDFDIAMAKHCQEQTCLD